MTVQPQGLVYICKTPLKNDYKNQLTFTNTTQQFNYFNSTVVKSFDNYTYIRKDNTITVGINIDEIINCNYLFYKNTGFTNKYYYCFITNMEYINEDVTRITIETDCFQTWYFDINYNKCFVEREHVNDDTIGLHTIPEGLEHGEYVSNKEKEDFIYGDDSYICIATNGPINLSDNPNRIYFGIFSGLVFNICKTFASANTILRYLASAGRNEVVNSIFMIPSALATGNTTTYNLSFEGVSIQYYVINSSTEAVDFGAITFDRPTKLGKNYTPKNNKLFTFPYAYFNVSNNSGINVNFNYEDFTNINKPVFQVYGVISPGCSIKAIPRNYKNVTLNYEEGINGGKYPVCSWASDSYTNWLTQQSINQKMTMANAGLNILSGLFTLNPSGVIGGVNQIGGLMSEKYQHSLQPYQSSGNTNAGDVTFSSGNVDFNVYFMSIKDEYAKIIDEYFSMFGYKVNTVKIPNINGRVNWNYVKTVDCNFDGNIPQSDLNIIKTMFNSGVTLWHNPTNIYNYSLTNNIV